MTIRQCFEACLVELDKVQAPSLLLEDFNYLFNKAIQKYYNRRYSLFESNQQLTDDLRVLVRTVRLTPRGGTPPSNVFGDSVSFALPEDYVHLLNCVCEFSSQCGSCRPEEKIHIGANKMSSNEWSQIINNYYMRPSMRQPYYYIQNTVDTDTYPISGLTWDSNGTRYGNSTIPNLEIKCGNASSSLDCIYIEYLIAPKHVRLEFSDLDKPVDDTDPLEFPDYVIHEIINELVTSILENQSNPRIQTYPTVNNSITAPLKR